MTAVVASDDRAYLAITEPCRYALGPDPTHPAITFNAVDSSGVMWVLPEPLGWDAATASVPLDRRQYGDGAYAGQGFFTERILTFEGSFAAPSNAAAEAARARLLAAVQADLLNPTFYAHLDESPARGLSVLPNDKPVVTLAGRWGDFKFSMVAPDPYKIGTGGSYTYGPARLPSSTGGGGRTYPRVYPVTYGSIGSLPTGGPVFVPNVGDSSAEAVYTVTGPVPQPVIVFSTGAFLGLNLTLASTDELVVDTSAGTVEVNGVNRIDALLADSVFPLIPSGGVTVQLTSTAGGTDQAASLYVTAPPTWK